MLKFNSSSALIFLILFLVQASVVKSQYLKEDKINYGIDPKYYHEMIYKLALSKTTPIGPKIMTDVPGVHITQSYKEINRYNMNTSTTSTQVYTQSGLCRFSDKVWKIVKDKPNNKKWIEVHTFPNKHDKISQIDIKFELSFSEKILDVAETKGIGSIIILTRVSQTQLKITILIKHLKLFSEVKIIDNLILADPSYSPKLSIYRSSFNSSPYQIIIYPKAGPRSILSSKGHSISIIEVSFESFEKVKEGSKAISIGSIKTNIDIGSIFPKQDNNASDERKTIIRALSTEKSKILNIGQIHDKLVVALLWKDSKDINNNDQIFSQMVYNLNPSNLDAIFTFPLRIDLRGIISSSSVRLGIPEGYHIEIEYKYNSEAYGYYAKDIKNPLLAVPLTFSNTKCGKIASDSLIQDQLILSKLRCCINYNSSQNNDIFEKIKQPEYLNFNYLSHQVDKVSLFSESHFIVSYIEQSSGDYMGSLFLNTLQSGEILPRNIEFGYKSSQAINILYSKRANIVLLQQETSTVVMGFEHPQFEIDYMKLPNEYYGQFISFYNPATFDTKKPIQYKQIGRIQDWYDLNYGDKNKTFYDSMDYNSMRMDSIQRLDLIESSFLPDKGQKLEVVTNNTSRDDKLQIVNSNLFQGKVDFGDFIFAIEIRILKRYFRILEGNILVYFEEYGDKFKFYFFKYDYTTKRDLKCKILFTKIIPEMVRMQKQIEIIRHGDYFLVVGITETIENSYNWIIYPIEDQTKGALPLKFVKSTETLFQNTSSKFSFLKSKSSINLYFILSTLKIQTIIVKQILRNTKQTELEILNQILDIRELNNDFSQVFCPAAVKHNEITSDGVQIQYSIISDCKSTLITPSANDKRKSIQKYVAFYYKYANRLSMSSLYINISEHFKDSQIDKICHFNRQNLLLFSKVNSEGEVGSFVDFGKDASFRLDKLGEKDVKFYSTNIRSVGEVEKLMESGCLERRLGAYVRIKTKKGKHKLVLINNPKKDNLFKGNRLLGVIDLEDGKEDDSKVSMSLRGKELLIMVIYGSENKPRVTSFTFNLLKNSYIVKTSKNKITSKYSYRIKSDDKQILSGNLGVSRPVLKNILYFLKLKKLPPKLEINETIKLEEFLQITGPYYGSRIRGSLSSKVEFKDRLFPLPVDNDSKPDYVQFESHFSLKVFKNSNYIIELILIQKQFTFEIKNNFVAAKIAKNIIELQTIVCVSVSHYLSKSVIDINFFTSTSIDKVKMDFKLQVPYPQLFWDLTPFLMKYENGEFKLIVILMTKTQAFKFEVNFTNEKGVINSKISLLFENISNINRFYIQNSNVREEYYGVSFNSSHLKRIKVGEKQMQIKKIINYEQEGFYLISNDAIYSTNKNLKDIKKIREIPSDFEILEMISSYATGYDGYIARKITMDQSQLDRFFILIFNRDKEHTHFIQEFKFTDIYYGVINRNCQSNYSGLMGINQMNILVSSNQVRFLTKGFTKSANMDILHNKQSLKDNIPSNILKNTVKVDPSDKIQIFSMVTMTMNKRNDQQEQHLDILFNSPDIEKPQAELNVNNFTVKTIPEVKSFEYGENPLDDKTDDDKKPIIDPSEKSPVESNSETKPSGSNSLIMLIVIISISVIVIAIFGGLFVFIYISTSKSSIPISDPNYLMSSDLDAGLGPVSEELFQRIKNEHSQLNN